MVADFRKSQFILLQNEVSDEGSSGERQPEGGSEVPSDGVDAQINKIGELTIAAWFARMSSEQNPRPWWLSSI